MSQVNYCRCKWCELQRRLKVAEDTVMALSYFHKGECWCEVAIGNPMYRDHTDICKQACAALAEIRRPM